MKADFTEGSFEMRLLEYLQKISKLYEELETEGTILCREFGLEVKEAEKDLEVLKIIDNLIHK